MCYVNANHLHYITVTQERPDFKLVFAFSFLSKVPTFICSILHDVAGALSPKGAPFLRRRIPIPMMVR